MEADHKADARSKWKQSQRYKRHKDTSKSKTAAQHQATRTKPEIAAQANIAGRHYDDVEEGPTIRSKGADLLELLQQTGPYDHAFYHKLRFDITREYGLPESSSNDDDMQQPLSFDLQALATCLNSIPLRQCLNLEEPSLAGLGDVQVAVGRKQEVEERQAGEHPRVVPRTNAQLDTKSSDRQGSINSVSTGPDPEKAVSGVVPPNQPLDKVSREGEPTAVAPAVPPSGSGPEGSDEELDFLLGLTAGKTGPQSQQQQQSKQAESIEDWLDKL